MAEPNPSVYIVEDHPEIMAQLRQLIDSSEGFKLAGHSPSVTHALDNLPGAKPDLVLMDIELPDGNGIDCTAKVLEQRPNTKILMLTIFEDEQRIIAAIAAGAKGYLLKETPPQLILAELQVLHLGGSPLSPKIAASLLNHRLPKSDETEFASLLSERETEVLNLISMGLTYKDIADEMDISPHTVRRHIEKIYKKLKVNSKSEAIIKGRRSGLIKDEVL